MAMNQPGGATQAPPGGGGNTVTNALTRQIGPLKAWQWGAVIGVAGLLYFAIKGRGGSGNSGTETTVPFTSGSDPNSPIDTLGGPDNPMHVIVDSLPKPVVPPVVKKLLYYRAKVLHRAPIYDRAGHIIGHLAAGRTILLGPRVKIHGIWYYPILNMPGKFIRAGKNFTLTAVYQNVTQAAAAVSNTIASPTTTSASQTTAYSSQNAPATKAEAISQASFPTVDNAYQFKQGSLQIPVYQPSGGTVN